MLERMRRVDGSAAASTAGVLRRSLPVAFACLAWSCGSDAPPATPRAGQGSGAPAAPAGASGAPSLAGGDIQTSEGGGEAPVGVRPGVLEGGGVQASGGGDDAGGVGVPVPDAGSVQCAANPGSLTDGDANIDAAAELQRISGFGGMDGGFYPELTPAQVDTAFGNGPGQVGLSIMRIRVPEAQGRFGTSVAAAARAVQLGALVMATPWTPPPGLKSNNNAVGGSLNVASYGAYADHLLAFRDFMQANGVPLYSISVQNEPDYQVTYESCDWTAAQLIDWISAHGSKFGETKLMAPESFNFNRTLSDPILNDAEAEAQVDIVAGHIYGGGVADYPLAREKGKEVWMTEHYTDSANPANDWPLALGVGADVHRSMAANWNAYVWWAIRRAYGLLTEDGVVSKRGYTIAQYSKFVRPGFVRVAATQPANVAVTAYKGGEQLVVVAINQTDQPQSINLDVYNNCATGLSRFTTSASKNLADDGPIALDGGRAAVTLEGQSITTFVSR